MYYVHACLLAYPSQRADIGYTLAQCYRLRWQIVAVQRWSFAFLKAEPTLAQWHWPNVITPYVFSTISQRWPNAVGWNQCNPRARPTAWSAPACDAVLYHLISFDRNKQTTSFCQEPLISNVPCSWAHSPMHYSGHLRHVWQNKNINSSKLQNKRSIRCCPWQKTSITIIILINQYTVATVLR